MNNGIDAVGATIACPQCAALVRVPHDSDFARCGACGSMLVLVQGVLTHVLRERVCVDREQAAAILRAWLGKQEYSSATVRRVGELRFFPFLRVTRVENETVVPLAAPPSPAVGMLAHAPTELSETDRPVEGIDQAELEAALSAALSDRTTRGLQVEARGYYSAEFTLGDEVPLHCSVVIGAGQGPVYPDALPYRAEHSGTALTRLLLALAVVLVAEAAAIPSLWIALVAIVATALAFCGAVLLGVVSEGGAVWNRGARRA